MSANELLTQVLNLPEHERAEIAHHLLMSLEPEQFDTASNAAWAAEMESRLARIEAGAFVAKDWRESIASMRQALSEGFTPRRCASLSRPKWKRFTV